MAKYRDIETNEIITTAQLKAEYEKLRRDNQTEAETFNDYLINCQISNNGTLEVVAPDWMINSRQRSVARDISCDDMPYEKVLKVFQKYNMFGNWTVYEINNRPVDIEELTEMCEQELGLY